MNFVMLISVNVYHHNYLMLFLAIIKSFKLMKQMISADTPVLFSKACELFIMELSFRGWLFAEANDRRTLERSDVINAISHANMFHFLSGALP